MSHNTEDEIQIMTQVALWWCGEELSMAGMTRISTVYTLRRFYTLRFLQLFMIFTFHTVQDDTNKNYVTECVITDTVFYMSD